MMLFDRETHLQDDTVCAQSCENRTDTLQATFSSPGPISPLSLQPPVSVSISLSLAHPNQIMFSFYLYHSAMRYAVCNMQ